MEEGIHVHYENVSCTCNYVHVQGVIQGERGISPSGFNLPPLKFSIQVLVV